MPARAANDALNAYIEARHRGLPVLHDHFTGTPHGGFAVFYVDDGDQFAALGEPGPLDGWTVTVHPLVFSLAPLGLFAQAELTIEGYGRTTLDELRAGEADDPRYWWRKRPE